MKALIWDVDGTLAETERDGHRVAFNLAFEAMGLPWRWDVAHYGALLAVTGGRERLLHDMAGRADAPGATTDREALARELHRRKNAHYAARVMRGAITLRPGVRALLDDCRAAGVRLAIATTTSRSNVDALLAAHGLQGFEACLCAEDAPAKKPDPLVYRMALQRLGLQGHETLALEDSPAGAAAATAAQVPVIVTRGAYFAKADFGPVLAIGPGLGSSSAGWQPAAPGSADRIDLTCLRHWHATCRAVSADNTGLTTLQGLQASP